MAVITKTARRPRSKRAGSAETRSRILEAATGLFARSGFDATGVAAICAAARVSKGSFYHHFPSKQALFLQLLENWLRDLEYELQQALRQAPTVVEGLLRMAARTRSIFESADGRLSIFLEFWAQARRDPKVWRRTVAPLQAYRDSFRAIITRGIEEGALAPVDPELASRALVSLALGTILQGVLEAGSTDAPGAQEPDAAAGGRRSQPVAWDLVMQDAVRLLIDGIGRRAS